MPSEVLLGGAIVVALMLYVLLAGADFGGGVWDLLAFGPRRARQRQAIEHAIGPIWEANHVWLILVVVVMFTAFPTAFAALSTSLHVPLTLFLGGVVFRGSAFAFRSFDGGAGAGSGADRGDRAQRRWGLIFSLASLISPLLLGMTVGAIASGRIRVTDGLVTGGFVRAVAGAVPDRGRALRARAVRVPGRDLSRRRGRERSRAAVGLPLTCLHGRHRRRRLRAASVPALG